MTAYVSMLRAVNVGGARKVSMADLAAVYESLGFEEVRTYIQSGNVVFRTRIDIEVQLERELEAAIAEQLGVETTVMNRTRAELSAVATANPFPPEYAPQVAIAFLSVSPKCVDTTAIARAIDPAESFTVLRREVFLHYPNGQGRSKMSNALLERYLGVKSTIRNWRTVNKLLELASD